MRRGDQGKDGMGHVVGEKTERRDSKGGGGGRKGGPEVSLMYQCNSIEKAGP